MSSLDLGSFQTTTVNEIFLFLTNFNETNNDYFLFYFKFYFKIKIQNTKLNFKNIEIKKKMFYFFLNIYNMSK